MATQAALSAAAEPSPGVPVSLETGDSAVPDRAERGGRRYLNQVLAIVVLAGLALAARLLIVPLITHGGPRPAAAVVLTVLLPYVTILALSGLERLFTPAGPRKSLGTWLSHLQMNLFWTLIAGFTFAFSAIAAKALAGYFGIRLGLIDLTVEDRSGILTFIGTLWLAGVIGDFFFYWYHRTLHTFPVLWQIHKIHHMDTELDATTLNRDSWLDAIAAAVLMSLPSAILIKMNSNDPWDLGLKLGTMATFFSIAFTLGHMNVRLGAGWFNRFYCSPQVHRIHHSCLAEHFDRNYAFFFPAWDMIFGTYFHPRPDEYPPTGVKHELRNLSFWKAQTLTVESWRRMMAGRPPQSDPSDDAST